MRRMPKLVEKGKKDRRLGEPSGQNWDQIEALELTPFGGQVTACGFKRREHVPSRS